VFRHPPRPFPSVSWLPAIPFRPHRAALSRRRRFNEAAMALSMAALRYIDPNELPEIVSLPASRI
jgi:hypothetical protein